jgi:hypothetical protein
MGSEGHGPEAPAPGPLQVTASAARAWAIAAATAATSVPAPGAEADAWIVRGWADVAVGCLALDGSSRSRGSGDAGPRVDGPGAFSGLDEVIGTVRVASAGHHAARLRGVRRLAGPVPLRYPDARPVSGQVRPIAGIVWRAASLVEWFGGHLLSAAAALPPGESCPLVSERQLAWGVNYRPSPSDEHVTLRLLVDRRLARRTWMCLPGLPGAGTAIAEVPSTAAVPEQQIWRGIHEGAHLDHLASLARLGHGAPSPGEFGAGLLLAESYAMAVELLAAVECILAGEGQSVRQLGAGLIERATRLPGGANPAAEFIGLPTLAEVYLLGPLDVLAGGPTAAALPAGLISSLHDRWRAACAAYPPAVALTSAAATLIASASARPLPVPSAGPAASRPASLPAAA